MVTLRIVNPIARIVIEEFHIVNQSATDMTAFDEVVTQNEVLRECPFQYLLEHPEVIDTLSAKCPDKVRTSP